MESYDLYNTPIFIDIWADVDSFITDFNNSPFGATIKEENARKLYFLLLAKYGNNPIASTSEDMFKIQVFSIIEQYGATWEKKIEIQKELRALTEEDILVGSKIISNQAENPDEGPYMGSEEALAMINRQNVSTSKRGKIEAYSNLWIMLEDITEPFIKRFMGLFKIVVNSERGIRFPQED